jgi:hypothetical protein
MPIASNGVGKRVTEEINNATWDINRKLNYLAVGHVIIHL